MSPLSSKTITRLDPSAPLLWRDEQTLQLGVDGSVRIEVVGVWVEALLVRMCAGFQRRGFDVIAHASGAPRDEARMLLRRLQPLLVDDPPPPPAVWVEGVNITDARCEYRMRDALADEGLSSGARTDPDAIGVILVQGAAAALQLAPYLSADIPHLPVAFETGRVTVGPLVVPGITPCLSCRDGHERDRDPAWPRLHAQLIARHSGPIAVVHVAEAAALAARILSAPESDASAIAQITADGARAWRSVTFHAECRCREQSFPSQRESATVPAPLVLPRATTTRTAFAQPA